MTSIWQRDEAENRIKEVLDAAVRDGSQQIVDSDGVFKITFEKKKGTLEELFATPGPISDGDPSS